MQLDRERVARAAFLMEAVLVGGNAVCVRFSNGELDPLWGAGLRFLLAAALLATVMAVLKLGLPLGRALLGTLLYGFMIAVGSGVVFVLYAVVIRLWSASRAAYAFVIAPVVTVLLSAWLDDEPITAGLVLGGLLVLAGVYVGALRPGDTSVLETT